MKYFYFLLFVLMGALIFKSGTAYAMCSNPSGGAGKVIYNADHNTPQFCDGTNWISMSNETVDDLGNHTATQTLSMGSNRIINVTNPTGAQDAATKAYVDTAVTGVGDDLGSGGTTTGNITINHASPTLYLVDTDHNSAMIHMNANQLHFLSGNGVGGGAWAINGSSWPLVINMTTDDVVFGGQVNLNEGNLNMGTQAITSSAGTIRDASGGWVRTYGDTGWYNGTYGGGWYMTDGTWVRSYVDKNIFTGGIMRADGGLQVDGVSAISGTGQLNADSQTLINVATPSAANDGANKAYVDAAGGVSLPTCSDGEIIKSTGSGWACAPNGCPTGYTESGSKCYKFYSSGQTYANAKSACLGESAILAFPNNASEDAAIYAMISGNIAWIGINDIVSEGTWMNEGGGSQSYTNWRGGEPNNAGNEDCVLLNWGGSSQWNDGACTGSYSYVCERPL